MSRPLKLSHLCLGLPVSMPLRCANSDPLGTLPPEHGRHSFKCKEILSMYFTFPLDNILERREDK